MLAFLLLAIELVHHLGEAIGRDRAPELSEKGQESFDPTESPRALLSLSNFSRLRCHFRFPLGRQR